MRFKNNVNVNKCLLTSLQTFSIIAERLDETVSVYELHFKMAKRRDNKTLSDIECHRRVESFCKTKY